MLASVAEPITQLPAIVRAFGRRVRWTLAVEPSVLDGDPLPQTPFESVRSRDAVAPLRGRVTAVDIVEPEFVVTHGRTVRAIAIREQRVERAQRTVVGRVTDPRFAVQVLDDDVEIRQRMQDRADR